MWYKGDTTIKFSSHWNFTKLDKNLVDAMKLLFSLIEKVTYFPQKSKFKSTSITQKYQCNNMGLVLGMVLRFCISVTKVSKLKLRKLRGLLPSSREFTGGNWLWLGKFFWPPPFKNGLRLLVLFYDLIMRWQKRLCLTRKFYMKTYKY